MKSLIPVLALALTGCVPWTVRPIDYKEASAAAALSPEAYVDSLWAGKLIPAVTRQAIDARELLTAIAASPADAQKRYGHREANGPCHFIVKSRGVVTTVDTKSRVGLALVDVAPLDGKPDVSIQIGPVLRGSSLRDATGLVPFSDFVNQLQFADVANELNSRVLKSILEPLHRSRLKGSTVSFLGTLTAQDSATPPLAELIPVVLTIEESHP